MRFRRLSFVAGWTTVIALAVIGFSAFGAPEGAEPDTNIEAATLGMGHTAGAYAGVSFVMLSGEVASSVSTSDQTADQTPADRPTAERSDSPTTTSVPMEVDASGWLSEIQVRALISNYFEPADVNRAVRIAWCESRFDPSSVNLRTGGIGLFQHLPRYWAERSDAAGFPGADPTDPEASVAAAAWEVYNGSGWEIFSCRG